MTIDDDFLLLHLRLAGVLMALLVGVNLAAARKLRWSEELARLSLVNRQISQVHGLFIVLILALFSALLLTTAEALLEPTPLSRAVLAGLTVFWAVRLAVQCAFFSPRIWRGHRFFTAMHRIFSALWVYVTAVLAAALWRVLG